VLPARPLLSRRTYRRNRLRLRRTSSGRSFYNYFRDYDAVTGRYVQSDPIGLLGGINTYAYAASNPTAYVDPEGLLFGGLVNAGESYGDSAAQYWADRHMETGNPLYAVPGVFAALWTPNTSDKTAATLAGGYAARVFGPFTTRGVPRFLARYRQYIRFDPPHHGKGWELDGRIPLWLREQYRKLFPLLFAGEGRREDPYCE
jgi:RHS repeat-associated protein